MCKTILSSAKNSLTISWQNNRKETKQNVKKEATTKKRKQKHKQLQKKLHIYITSFV